MGRSFNYADYEEDIERLMLKEFSKRPNEVKEYLSSQEAKEVKKSVWNRTVKNVGSSSLDYAVGVAYNNLRMLF